MCGTIVGTAEGEELLFGIENDEASLITQSVKVTHKRDKKEVRDKCGNVISVSYYNRMAELEIKGVTKPDFDLDIGDTVTLANVANIRPAVIGKLLIDEISTELSNEDYIQTTVKATAYELIV